MTPKNEINSFKNNIFEKSFVIFILIDIFMGGGQPPTKTLKDFGMVQQLLLACQSVTTTGNVVEAALTKRKVILFCK
jgi:hypothetical protein